MQQEWIRRGEERDKCEGWYENTIGKNHVCLLMITQSNRSWLITYICTLMIAECPVSCQWWCLILNTETGASTWHVAWCCLFNKYDVYVCVDWHPINPLPPSSPLEYESFDIGQLLHCIFHLWEEKRMMMNKGEWKTHKRGDKGKETRMRQHENDYHIQHGIAWYYQTYHDTQANMIKKIRSTHTAW